MATTGYRGRFAPSPTGPLHFGSLYTAIASYLQARSLGGKWLIRIDDLDTFRCKPEYATQILTTLEMFGLTSDEPVFYQSTRHEAYKKALKKLEQGGFLYACHCSRKNLLERQVVNGVYDQHCLNTQRKSSPPYAQRIKLPINALAFHDQVQGGIEQNLKQDVGDFIVLRKDNIAAYHLAVALDDNEQKITEALRGYDLLASTPRQIMLQQMLQLNTPNYAHIPVISNTDGSKLSKQTFAHDVSLSPIKQTLINVFLCLNMTPANDLVGASIGDILDWGVQHWSLANIHQRASIVLEPN